MKTRVSKDCHLWTQSERLQGQQQAAPEFDHCLLRKGRSCLEREEAVIGCVLVMAVSEQPWKGRHRMALSSFGSGCFDSGRELGEELLDLSMRETQNPEVSCLPDLPYTCFLPSFLIVLLQCLPRLSSGYRVCLEPALYPSAVWKDGISPPAFSAEFSTLSAGSKLALLSKVNVPGSSGQFSTSNKRLEPTPQSPHIARPLGFQLGWAAVRNEEWAWPKFGDVRWKLVLLGQPVQLCVSHSLPSSNHCSRRRLQAVSPSSFVQGSPNRATCS